MTIVKDHFFSTVRIDIVYRNVALGGPGGPGGEFCRSVNRTQTRGADYAPHTHASPLRFKKLSTPLMYILYPIGWLPMIKLTDCVHRGVFKLRVQMLSVNTVSAFM